MTEEGRREKERERRDALKIGGLSYCSIFECFVELSFNVAAKKPFQSSSRCQRNKGNTERVWLATYGVKSRSELVEGNLS